jgi:hypothetical protein
VVILVSSTISAQATRNAAKNEQTASSLARKELPAGKSLKTPSKLALALWTPPDVDAGVPSVTEEVPCQLEEVLRGASRRVEEFAANLERFTATETIDSFEIGRDGRSKRSLTNKFNYLAMVSHSRAGNLTVTESRKQTGKGRATPLPIQTVGLAIGAVLFHPANIKHFNMVCEGLGEWHARPAWLVHFEQHTDKSSIFQEVGVNQRWFEVRLRGRAWIAADNFQIAHLDFDLLKTIPQIRLVTEHMIVDYRAVNFAKRNTQLWLPESIDFYIDIQGHKYLNRHLLNNFFLFSVDASQEDQLRWMPN